jgi:Tol biopolymer transport system component
LADSGENVPKHADRSRLAEGRQLGHFKIIRRIGGGGMGEAYLAQDEHLDREVVIKTLLPDKRDAPRVRLRFDEGDTLARRIAGGRLDEYECIRIGGQICAALMEAHEHGILHRDLSPRNVMFNRRDEVKVLDFGLAKLVQADPDSVAPTDTQSVTRQIAGTVPYIAPERLKGQPADERSDIWSLGSLLYEMATGQRMFSGSTSAELIAATIAAEPRPVRELAPEISGKFETCVAKAAAKEPDERYQSAREMASDFAEGQPLWTTGNSALGRQQSRSRTARPGWWVALGIVLALAVASLGLDRLGFDDRRGTGSVSMEAVVTGMEWEHESRISPDARWVSWQTKGFGPSEIRVAPLAGGETRQVALTPGQITSHVWSPGSDRIAYVRRTDGKPPLILLASTFGAAAETAIELPDSLGWPAPVAWVGQTLYVATALQGLWTVGITGGAIARVLPGRGPEGPRSEFDVCDDGRRAAYTVFARDGQSIWTADFANGDTRRLTAAGSNALRGRWAGPDCDTVVHLSDRSGQQDLWRTDLQGRSSALTIGSEVEHPNDASVDGSLFTFSIETTRSDLWVFDPRTGGSNFVALTGDTREDLWPSINAKGSRIAFQRRAAAQFGFDPLFRSTVYWAELDDNRLGKLHLVAAEGGLVRMSPDGARIAFVRVGAGGIRELVVRELATSQERVVDRGLRTGRLEPDPFGPLWPVASWSPDARNLAYSTLRSDESSEVRIASADPRREPLVVATGPDVTSAQLCFSNDGRSLAALLESHPDNGPTVALINIDVATGASKVLRKSATDLESDTRLVGQGRGGDWVLLNRALTGEGNPLREVVKVATDGSERTILKFEAHVGPLSFDPPGERIYFTGRLPHETIQNIWVVDLIAREVNPITDNQRPSTFYSAPELFDANRLLYTQHESNSDVWLIHLER